MKFTQIARIEAISRISGASLTYACALKGMGVWSLVVQYLSYNMLQAILYSCHQRVLPGKISNLGQIKSILTFGFQVMLARVIYFLSGKTDTLVIGRIIGTKPLGVYSFALMLANKPIEKIMSILNQVLFPVFSKSQDDFDTVKRYVLKTLEIQLFIMLPIFLFIFLCADVVIRLFLGGRWLGIILPLKVFAIIGIFQYVRSLCSMLAVSLGRPKLDVYYNSAVLIILTSAMVPLGYMYKLEGILLAWIIIYPVITLTYFIILIKIIGITFKIVFDRIYLPVFITGAMSVSLFFYHRLLAVTNWLEFFFMCIFSLMVYSLTLLLVDRSKALEILNLIKSVNVRPIDAKT